MISLPTPQSLIHLYVWHERFLYLGPGARTTPHRNHAATWLIAHRGKMRVELGDGQVLEDEAIYVPSETEFATISAPARIAALYWEPESDSFLRAAAKFDAQSPRAFQCEYANTAELASLARADLPLDTADALLHKVFGLNPQGIAPTGLLDERIAEAITFLRVQPNAYESIETLAERVHLSPSRFQHLFKEQIGIPVRRYVLWQKMRQALNLAMAGESLTSAALTAGFADSAHLSRTVRAIMGVAPEFLFKHRQRLVVHQ
jgi:AraC family transcriptional regulator